MQAVILCGGLGTRLRSVVSEVPKSMAPIRGTPFLELLLRSVARQGVTEFVFATGHRAEQIEDYFEAGERWGVRIQYSREPEPLGTAGALKLAEPKLSGPFLALNGDTYAAFELAPLAQLRERENALMAMVLKRVTDPARYGSVEIHADRRIHAFVEKGVTAQSGVINAGVYVMKREILDHIPPGRPCSLEKEVMPAVLERGIFGLEMNGPFIDIGIPEDYARAQALVAGIDVETLRG